MRSYRLLSIIREIASRRRRNLATLVVLVVMLISAGARPIAAQTSGAALPESATSKRHAESFGTEDFEVPFVSINNWIILNVKLGKDSAAAADAPTLHFLLDTGASETAISKETLDSERLHLPTSDAEGAGERIIGAGDSPNVVIDSVVDATIAIGGVDISSRLDVFPMGNDLRADAIDGVLGGDFIRRYVVYVDYATRVVRFYDPAKFQAPPSGDSFVSVPLEIDADGIPIIGAELTPFGFSKAHVNLELDTGDDGAVTLYSPFVARNKWQDVLPVKVDSVSVGVGGETASRDGRLRRLQFGATTLNQPPVAFSINALGAMADTQADGQLGGLIFARFAMIFDYGRRILYLRPSENVSSPFPPMRYFGFGTSDSETAADGCIIDTVAPGSPVALAGIRLGDTLYKVDGRTVAGLSGDALMQLLDASGDDRVFEVGHDGEPHRFVRVKPITY